MTPDMAGSIPSHQGHRVQGSSTFFERHQIQPRPQT